MERDRGNFHLFVWRTDLPCSCFVPCDDLSDGMSKWVSECYHSVRLGALRQVGYHICRVWSLVLGKVLTLKTFLGGGIACERREHEFLWWHKYRSKALHKASNTRAWNLFHFYMVLVILFQMLCKCTCSYFVCTLEGLKVDRGRICW